MIGIVCVIHRRPATATATWPLFVIVPVVDRRPWTRTWTGPLFVIVPVVDRRPWTRRYVDVHEQDQEQELRSEVLIT